MVFYLWGAGGGPSSILPDLITNVRLNQNGQPFFKGTPGWEDTIQLGWFTSDGALTFLPNTAPVSPVKTLQFKDNPGNLLTYIRSDGLTHVSATVPGALNVQPNVDPAASTQVIQVLAAGGATQFYVTATGGLMTSDVASLTSLSTPTINGNVNVQGVLTVPGLVVTGAASIGNLAATTGAMLPSLIVAPGAASIKFIGGGLVVTGAYGLPVAAESPPDNTLQGGSLMIAGGTASAAFNTQVILDFYRGQNAVFSIGTDSNLPTLSGHALTTSDMWIAVGQALLANKHLGLDASGNLWLRGTVAGSGLLTAGGASVNHLHVAAAATIGGLLYAAGGLVQSPGVASLNAIVTGAGVSIAGVLNVAGAMTAQNGLTVAAGTASVAILAVASGATVQGRIVASSVGSSGKPLLNFVPIAPTAATFAGTGGVGPLRTAMPGVPSGAAALATRLQLACTQQTSNVGLYEANTGDSYALAVGASIATQPWTFGIGRLINDGANQCYYIVNAGGGVAWTVNIEVSGYWELA